MTVSPDGGAMPSIRPMSLAVVDKRGVPARYGEFETLSSAAGAC